MAADAAGCHVTHGGRLRLSEFCEQRRHPREHLLVDTECHGSDSNSDAAPLKVA
jgi:hypothetical protein